jgi:hypothetical protein
MDQDDTVRGLREEFRSAQREVNLKKHLARNLIMDQGTEIKTAIYDEPKKAVESALAGESAQPSRIDTPDASPGEKDASPASPETGGTETSDVKKT